MTEGEGNGLIRREMAESINHAPRRHDESQDRIAEASKKAHTAGQRSITALQDFQTLIESQLSR